MAFAHLRHKSGQQFFMRGGALMMIGTREVIHRLDGLWPPSSAEPLAEGPLALTSTPTRRHEPRSADRTICAYELCESINEESVVIQQGEVFTVNRSGHGIQVLMGYPPRAQQLIELHIPESRWRRTVNLYEVQWTKAVPMESDDQLFLVGCRLTFGPSRYWAF
jgi:hypothetical protein